VTKWLLAIWGWISTSGGHLAAGALAIVAAFGVGSWVSAQIAGEYQTKNILRTMRSTWINDLREDLASFASYAHKYDDVLKKQKKTTEQNERLHQMADQVSELRAQKNRLAHQVIMRLNPFEEDHIKGLCG
jgi:hypothetical protein